jgi:hypothetical protein
MLSSNFKGLALYELTKGMYGITSAFGECLSQAASICLEDQEHRSGVHLSVDGDFNGKFPVIWKTTTEQMRRCWADPEVTTEHGAYGIAALLIPTLTDLTIVHRSRKGTGFDFWLGPVPTDELLFQEKARLEVSGIRKGNKTEIKSRLKQKIEQTKRSDGALSAYIVVVEFGEPQSRVVKR